MKTQEASDPGAEGTNTRGCPAQTMCSLLKGEGRHCIFPLHLIHLPRLLSCLSLSHTSFLSPRLLGRMRLCFRSLLRGYTHPSVCRCYRWLSSWMTAHTRIRFTTRWMRVFSSAHSYVATHAEYCITEKCCLYIGHFILFMLCQWRQLNFHYVQCWTALACLWVSAVWWGLVIRCAGLTAKKKTSHPHFSTSFKSRSLFEATVWRNVMMSWHQSE